MNNIKKMQGILAKLQVPSKQQSEICAYTLLAMANLHKTKAWADATNEWMRIHDIIEFTRKHYRKTYAENSRETFRKQAIHHFRNAAFVEDNGKATNSPDYRYRLTSEFLSVIRQEGAEEAISNFLEQHESLISIYASKKRQQKIPITINGKNFSFSTGKHNMLQKAIIEEFGPRFAPGSECLYVGDTTAKNLVKNEIKLQEIGMEITLHDKMPDVVFYSKEKDWLYFIEAVTSVGPMDNKRIVELNELTKKTTIGKIFVTAFLDFKTFKKFSEALAWDTEVWIADMPDHMIHLNGDKFLGPR